MSKKQVTLATGPFHVPRLNQVPADNNRLIVTLKNPTNKPLKASVEVGVCDNFSGSITLPFVFNTPEVPFASFPKTVIPNKSCTRWELFIGSETKKTLRVTTVGEYAIDDGVPVCGKLEITVLGGRGGETGGIPDAGLDFADPTLFFRYKDFVLCKKEHNDD